MEMHPGTERDAEGVAPRMEAAAEPAGGEVLRMRITDPDAWHDLAERGTPRNG